MPCHHLVSTFDPTLGATAAPLGRSRSPTGRLVPLRGMDTNLSRRPPTPILTMTHSSPFSPSELAVRLCVERPDALRPAQPGPRAAWVPRGPPLAVPSECVISAEQLHWCHGGPYASPSSTTTRSRGAQGVAGVLRGYADRGGGVELEAQIGVHKGRGRGLLRVRAAAWQGGRHPPPARGHRRARHGASGTRTPRLSRRHGQPAPRATWRRASAPRRGAFSGCDD